MSCSIVKTLGMSTLLDTTGNPLLIGTGVIIGYLIHIPIIYPIYNYVQMQ